MIFLFSKYPATSINSYFYKMTLLLSNGLYLIIKIKIKYLKVATNLVTLQTCLTSMMGRPITMDQLRQDVGTMVEKITKVITTFRDFHLTMQEYVCLKVVAMVTNTDGEFFLNSKTCSFNKLS